MNKKAQFYIIAAITLVLIISGFASVKTYAIAKPEPRKIKDISAELTEEGSRIIDYGIYNKKNITSLISNFTDMEFAPYFLKKTENTSIVFIYGNKTELYSVQYIQDYTGTISAFIGTGAAQWNVENIYANRTKIISSGDQLNVTILDKKVSFELKDNEMFYFVIAQEKEKEIYLEKN